MMQKRLKIIVCFLSFRKSQQAESRDHLGPLNKGSTLYTWILGMAPKLHLLTAKPSAKLWRKINFGNTGHVPVIKRQFDGPGTAKISTHSFWQDRTGLTGQIIRTNSQNGPFSKLWRMEQGDTLLPQEKKDTRDSWERERKCPAQEQYKLLYVSTTLLTSKHLPALGLPELGLEFEI